MNIFSKINSNLKKLAALFYKNKHSYIPLFFKFMFIIILSFSASCNDDNMILLFEDKVKLVSIEVNPADSIIPMGLSINYTATGTYSNGTTRDISDSVDWISTDIGVLKSTNREDTTFEVIGVSLGTTTIEAKIGRISGNSGLTVTAPDLVSIAVTPVDYTIDNGLSLQYTATGTYTDSSTADITGLVTWSSTNTGVATINSSGLATSVSAGGTMITAIWGAISDTTNLTVNEAVEYLKTLNDTIERSELVSTAVLDNQDRLLIGGRLRNANWDAAIWRYNLDGSLDTSFGTNGVVSWNSPEDNTDYVSCIKVKPDGTILIGGTSIDSLSDVNAFVARLLPDGQPDTGFSPDGFKYIDIDRTKIRRRETMTFDSSDRLLFSGVATISTPWVAGIARITTSGIIDTTFSNMGYFIAPKPAVSDYEGGIIVDSGYIYKVVKTNDGYTKIYKLNESDGNQVDLIENIPINAYTGIAIHGDYLYFGGYLLFPDRYAWAKINKTDFTYDLTYGNNSIGDGSPLTDGGRGSHINVNTNGEAYIGGTYPFGQDGMIIKANTSGFVDTSWGTSGAISYVSVGGVDAQIDYVTSTVFYNDKMFIFGYTVTEINSTLYYKMFIHYTSQ